MGISNYLVDTVEVAVDNYETSNSAPDPSTLVPVSCLSVAGKRTAQNFHAPSAFMEPGAGGKPQDAFLEMDRDPMPLQAQHAREQLREIDGRNTVGRRRGEGLSSPRESRANADGRLLEELKLTATYMSHEKYLTASLDRKYGKTAGKGSLVHPHAHEHGIMVDSVGRLVPKGSGGKQAGTAAGKAGKGLQGEVVTLAKMHADSIDKERKDAEKVDDVEQAMIRRNAHKEAAASKKVKGSSCFATISRERAHLGNRMAPPVSHFGPGHYNISYNAQEKHSGVKDMRASWMPGGRHLLDMGEFFQDPPKSPTRDTTRRPHSPEKETASRREPAVGEEGDIAEAPAAVEGEQRATSSRALRISEEASKVVEEERRRHPMTSSFLNTGFGSPLVGRKQPPNGGAHLGPTKYSAKLEAVKPAPHLIANFVKQTTRPPMAKVNSDPGPGQYDYVRPGELTASARKRLPRTRAFDKQTGRDGPGAPDYLADAESARPYSAPVVVHQAAATAPMPFSRAALEAPFAPAQALAALARGRALSPHAVIAATWDKQTPKSANKASARPSRGDAGMSYADIGMGQWFDEWGNPLQGGPGGGLSAGSGGAGYDSARIAAEYAGARPTRFGGIARPADGEEAMWGTGGLRSPPKLGTMPRSSRTAEVAGLRLSGSIKSGGTSTGPRASAPDPRGDLRPQYDVVRERAPSWSLPRNRTDKPKKWQPPRKLLEAHMY